MALSWQVPTGTVNNNFSVTLVSDDPLTGVEVNDFRLRGGGRNIVDLDSSNTRLTQVSGTNNWRLDFTLTGTFAEDILIQLRRNRVLENGVQAPSSNLNSATFRLDSSYRSLSSPATPAGLTLTAGYRQITATCNAVTNDGGSPVTDYEMQIKLASVAEWGTTWTRIGLDRQHLFSGLQDNTAYDVRVRAVNAVGNSAPSTSVQATTSALSIEAIDTQTIPVLTEDYELEIDIGGAPERAYVDGDMEGFHQHWDPDAAHGTGSGTGVLYIRAEKVTRLISDAIWNVHLVRGTKTVDGQIIYNVVPSAPVIADPGAQKLYKGGRFSLNVDIANAPTLARGNALLTGLKYAARPDGADGLNIAGRLPAAANLTEAAFNANIYTENNGGQDNLAVPVTIETHTGVYVFDRQTDDLLKIGPDAATLHWTYEAPGHRTDYDDIVVSPDGIYLFNDGNDDLLKVSPDGALLWTFDTATAGTYNEIAVTESGVYVHRSTAIYKVDLSTGELIWESNVSYSTGLSRVYADDVYVLNRGTRILTKLNGADGTVAWTYDTSHRDYYLRAVAGDGVYIQNRSQLRKIDIETGELAWEVTLSGSSFYAPVADSSGFYTYTTTHDRLYKINASDGTLAWTFNTPSPQSNFRGPPTLGSDGIYLDGQTAGQWVLKVNLSDGTEAWRVSGIVSLRWLYPNGLYGLVRFQNTLRKINISDGTEDWSVAVPGIRDARHILEDGSDVYALATFGSSNNDLVKLNVSDGSEQWRYEGPESGSVFAQLAIPDFSLGG